MKKSVLMTGVALAAAVAFVWNAKRQDKAVDTVSAEKPAAVIPPKPEKIVLYNWSSYFVDEVRDRFEREYGIKVVEEFFESGDVALNKLQTGGEGYDVIIESDYMAQRMIQAGVLAEISANDIPNIKYINPTFRGLHFDPKNSYTVPYFWGTTGIGYDTEKLKNAPTTWSDIFDPTKISAVKNRISMLDEPREAVGAALKYLGYSANSENPDELQKAKEVLVRQRPFVGRYDSSTYMDLLTSGELTMVQGWSGDILKQRRIKPTITYFVPKEGTLRFMDNLSVVKSSKNKYWAAQFINFVHNPEINAILVNNLQYPSPNEEAKKYVKPEILNDPLIYIPEDLLVKAEWMKVVSKESGDLYDQVWTEVKASH